MWLRIVLKFHLENHHFIDTYYIQSIVLGTIEGLKKKGRVIFKEKFYSPVGKKVHKYKDQHINQPALWLNGDWFICQGLLEGHIPISSGGVDHRASFLGRRPQQSGTALNVEAPHACVTALQLAC